MSSPNVPSRGENSPAGTDREHSQTITTPPPSPPPPQSSNDPEPAQAPDVHPAPHASQTLPQNKPATARLHRAHFAAGHKQLGSRNLSQKNLNKFQRLANELGPGIAPANAAVPGKRQHARKKSAPVMSTDESTESSKIRFEAPPKLAPSVVHGHAHVTRPLMRRYLSTPVMHNHQRNPPTSKKSNMHAETGDKRQSTTKKQKKVGFQLAPTSSEGDDDDDDDDEWEDNSNTASYTPSTISTGPNSVIQGGAGAPGPSIGERTPNPSQPSLRSSLTKMYSTSDLSRRNAQDVDMKELLSPINSHKPSLLRLQPSKKASPSVSSINVSAVKPLHAEQPRAGSHASPTETRPGLQTAPSSAEVGVSRFLDSNNAPGSSPPGNSPPPTGFHTNYDASSAGPSRLPPGEYRLSDLASRTQQKLWLQRKEIAPESSGRAQVQTGNPEVLPTDASTAPGVPSVDKKKHDWKLYRKVATEFSVVHRFRDPVADSFRRLALLPRTQSNLPQEGVSPDSKLQRSRSAVFGPFEAKKTPASNALGLGGGTGTTVSPRPRPRRWNTQHAPFPRRDAHDQHEDAGLTMRGPEQHQSRLRPRAPLPLEQHESLHSPQQAAYNQQSPQPLVRRLPIRSHTSERIPGAQLNSNQNPSVDQNQGLPYPPRHSEEERLLERLWNTRDAL